MTSRFKDHILVPGTHVALPTAATTPEASLYLCTTHNKIYRVTSGAWADWATLVSTVGTKTINAQTGTSYTLVLSDADRVAFLTMNNAAASTLTVPPNSSVAFPVGTVIEGMQIGAGQVTLTPGAGVTLNATPGLKVAAQWGTFGLIKIATDTWVAYGRLST